MAGQRPNECQFHPLHGGFDATKGMATQSDFVRGKNEPQPLAFTIVLEFGEGELVKRQQQALFSGNFDFDRASVRIARPTFGWFCAHGL